MSIYIFQAEAFIALATALDQAGHHTQAQSIWQKAERVTASINHPVHDQVPAWRHLAKAFAKVHRWQEAERVLSSIEDGYWRSRTSRSLAKAFAKAHLWQEAKRITASISERSYRMVALRSLARDLAKAQMWQEAEKIAASITDVTHQVIAFHHIVQCLANAGYQVQAQKVQQTAAKAAASIDYASSKLEALEAFHELVPVFTQAQHWHEAERIASSFDHRYYRARAFQEVAIAATKAGRHAQAQSLWREAEKIIRSDTSITALHRDSSLYGLVTALIQAQQWQEAERVIQLMPQAESQTD